MFHCSRIRIYIYKYAVTTYNNVCRGTVLARANIILFARVNRRCLSGSHIRVVSRQAHSRDGDCKTP